MTRNKAPRDRTPARPPRNKPVRPPLTREAILEFLASHPDEASKRDLAKHFGIKGGEQKIALKRLLKDLTEDGKLERQTGKTYVFAGSLPEVLAVEVTDRDPDGELLCQPQKWIHSEPPPRILLAPGEAAGAGDTPALGIGERFLARLLQQSDGTYEARLIRKLGQSAHRVLGIYRKAGKQGRLEPVDRKARFELVIETADSLDARDGELALAEPLAARSIGLPRAKIVERLGPVTGPRAVSLIAIHAHGIPDQFPRSVIDEAEAAQAATPDGRTDLRHLPFVTIDPKDARDHDDAVYAAPDDDPGNHGGFKAAVAIADVGAYVRPGSALDQEAFKRGNSVYFPDRVVPMLPERLSADLCSLNEDVDRPVIVAHLKIAANGRIKGHRFERALIRSRASFTYEEAQAAADGQPTPRAKDLLRTVIEPLWACYRALQTERDRRSPLDLDVTEHQILLSADGKVTGVTKRARFDAHRLIEEFMIQANVAAAEALNAKRTPLIFRIHDQPSAEKLESLSDFLRTLNISLPKTERVKTGQLNGILDRVRGSTHQDLVNEVMLRSQAQAIYNPENIGHFGLNLKNYAHFTSPIRRYADLIVHRSLIRAFDLGTDGLREREIERLEDIAQHISSTERRAMAAERDSIDRYMAAFMADRIGAQFPGRISGVTRFGLFVRLSETGADGLIPIRSLGSEHFVHDERTHALIGERTGLTFRLGDSVTVTVVEAAPVTGGLRFDLAVGGQAGNRPSPQQLRTARLKTPHKTRKGRPTRRR